MDCARWSSRADSRWMCQREGRVESGCSVESAVDRFHIEKACSAGCSALPPAPAGSYPYPRANPETAQNHPIQGVLYDITK